MRERLARVVQGSAAGPAARLPRPLARLQHEGGVGRGLTGEQGAVVDDAEVAIEPFVDVDLTARIGAPPRAARDLHPACSEVHGVVASHDALIPAAQEVGEIPRGRTPRGRSVGGRPRKAAREIGEELRQEGVAVLERADAPQAQFAGEPILQRVPEAFDAALGLRRVGANEADAEGLQHAAEVRRVLVALDLFGERPVGIVAREDVEAVAVEFQRHAIHVGRCGRGG